MKNFTLTVPTACHDPYIKVRGSLVLTQERETILLNAWHSGDRDAAQQLVAAHRPLVERRARELQRKNEGYVERDDLISEGELGLWIALQRFVQKHGVRFNTYARWWVHNRMSAHIRERRWPIRIPDTIHRNVLTVSRAMGRLSEEAKAAGEVDGVGLANAVAERTKLSEASVKQALSWLNGSMISLDLPVGSSGTSTLGDHIEDTKSADDDRKAVEDSYLSRDLRTVLQVLSPIEERILRLRFGVGFNDGEPQTLAQIAKPFELSPERVRQIESKAPARLRDPIEMHILEPHMKNSSTQSSGELDAQD